MSNLYRPKGFDRLDIEVITKALSFADIGQIFLTNSDNIGKEMRYQDRAKELHEMFFKRLTFERALDLVNEKDQRIYNVDQPTPVFRSPQPTNVPSEPSEPSEPSKNEPA